MLTDICWGYGATLIGFAAETKNTNKEVSPGGVTVNMTNSVLSFFVIASITWFSPTVVGLILLSRRKKRIAVVPPRNL